MTSAKAILIVAAVLLSQGVTIFMTDTADGAIAVHSIIEFFEGYRTAGATFLIASATCSAMGVLKKEMTDRVRMLFVFPQQFAMFVYATGALTAIMRESYADGVLRSWAFIETDQLFLLATFAIHSISIGGKIGLP